MAAKRFLIATPEQLRGIAEFVKLGKLDALIRVWTATKRRQGESHWDHAFYAGFSGDRNKVAEIARIDAENEVQPCATLHYNLALRWCERNLEEIYGQ